MSTLIYSLKKLKDISLKLLSSNCRLLFIYTLIIFISGCQSLSKSTRNFNVEVIRNEPMKVRFSQITTEISGKGLHVGGIISKNTIQSTDGHIDIAIYSASGQLLKPATTDYVSSLNFRKLQQRGGNRFSTDIQFVPPAGSTIKIAYHENRYQKPVPPTHNCNIITSCDEGAVSDTRGIKTESIERNADRQ